MTEYAYTIGGEPITFRPSDDHFRADQDGVETWHPRAALAIWDNDERAARGIVRTEVPAPTPTVEEICRQIDAERDRRQALDLEYDFRDAVAVLDDDTQERAGIRSLQMAPRNKTDWLGQQARALADPGRLIFVRASDNANLVVPAPVWLAAFEFGADRDERLMAYGGRLKSQVRAAENPSLIDWREGWPE